MRIPAVILSALSLVLAVMTSGGKGQVHQPVFDISGWFELDKPSIQLEAYNNITYVANTSYPDVLETFSIILLRTLADQGEPANSSNTWKIAEPQSGICISEAENQCDKQKNPAILSSVKSGDRITLQALFKAGTKLSPGISEGYFFCALHRIRGAETCMFYSSVFAIANGDEAITTASGLVTPQSKPSIVAEGGDIKQDQPLPPNGSPLNIMGTNWSTDIVTILNVQTIFISATATSLSTVYPTTVASMTTLTASSSGDTSNITPPATVVTLAEATLKSNSGLSTAAKIGIALGVLAFLLILLLLALLFLRRKHTKRNQPEQVMLTRSMHTDSFSRALATEKEDPTASAAATPIDEPVTSSLLPVQRHAALEAYEPISSAPYAGAAAAIPKRKPTAATLACTVSRGVSTTSGTTSSGARSPRSGDGGYEQYRDVVPVCGEARHVPQVFVGNSSARGMQSPFLEEEDITPEDVARLEEEERRIDAAIAEAERR